jgi:GNAT superfamily N-acetyltransferase
VLGSEGDRLRELRLLSLGTDPDAFGSTHAYELEYPAERWTQWAADSEDETSQRTFVAATDPDEWLGMALVRLEADEPATAALFAMWVARQARGQGVATLLCDAGAAWAAELGCRDLRLWVVVANDSARRAY